MAACLPRGKGGQVGTSFQPLQRLWLSQHRNVQPRGVPECGCRLPDAPPPGVPPPATHKLMLSCWHRDPEQRPCFRALRERLSSVSRYENPL